MSIHDDIRQFIASAIPANSNRVPCNCAARPTPQLRINKLLAQLDDFTPVGSTYERAPRLIFNPAPWQRAAVGGRPLR